MPESSSTSVFQILIRCMGGAAVRSQFAGVVASSRALRSGLLGIRTSLAGAGASLVLLGLAVRRVIRDYEEYSNSQARLRSNLATTTLNFEANTRIVTGLSEAIARRLGFSLTEANDGMNDLIETGIGVHAAMQLFGHSMTLARVADLDVTVANRFLIDSVRVFQSEMADSGETLDQFSERLTSQLVVGARMASTDVAQLQRAFVYAGTEMGAFGYTSRETIAALAGLSAVGIRSEKAGTRLRGAIVQLNRITGTSERYMRQFGITGDEVRGAMWDETGQVRGLEDAMNRLHAIAMRIPTQQERMAVASRLFGQRSLSAGLMLMGLGTAGQEARRVLNGLGQDLERNFNDAREERIRSFAFQMQQFREGLTELGVAFGEILTGEFRRGERGFGDFVRQLAGAVRLSGQLNELTPEQRREWQRYGTDIQQLGINIRSTLRNIADLLRVLGGIARVVLRISAEHPRLIAGFIMLRLVGIQLIPTLTTLNGVLRGTTTGLGATAMKAGVVVLILHGLLMGIERLQEGFFNWFSWLFTIGVSYDQVSERADRMFNGWITKIPVLGRWLNVAIIRPLVYLLRMLGLLNRNLEWADWITGRVTLRGPGMQARVSGRRMEEREWELPEEREARATNREATNAMQEFATITYAAGIRSSSQLARSLEGTGLAGDQLQRTIQDVRGYQQRQGEQLNQDARSLVSWSERMFHMDRNVRDAAYALAEFRLALAEAVPAGGETPLGETTRMPEVWEAPLGGDIAVRRSGFLPFRVSAGDVLLSQRELASALATRPGGMVGPVVAGERRMAGPEPSAGGGSLSGEVSVPVVLNLDGREIARAVGRVHVTQLERSGGSFAPGTRRLMRETGFGVRGQ